jgi:hypothetical protein
VVLRLSPSVEGVDESNTLSKIPIGGHSRSFIVTDNQGYLWADNARFGGVLAGLTSHRGSFILSYYPFKGSKEMGFAKGKQITAKLTDELRVTVRGDRELIPGDMKVKVYGKYIPKVKTLRPTSRISYGQDNLEGFPKELR